MLLFSALASTLTFQKSGGLFQHPANLPLMTVRRKIDLKRVHREAYPVIRTRLARKAGQAGSFIFASPVSRLSLQ